METNGSLSPRVALVTGAAHRIGARIAHTLHRAGADLVLHYRNSKQAADAIAQQLNGQRAGSVVLVQGDLNNTRRLSQIVDEAAAAWGRLDVLVNNASTFYSTPPGSVTEEQWQDLLGTNLRAPFFLSQAAAPFLRSTQGCIVNLADIHADRPLKNYPVYSIAKAGLVMLTKALAGELGPEIRVNAVAPGAILWPEHGLDEVTKQRIVSRTFLKRQGDPDDIAQAVLYLVRDAGYMTGQVLTLDGGRSLNN